MKRSKTITLNEVEMTRISASRINAYVWEFDCADEADVNYVGWGQHEENPDDYIVWVLLDGDEKRCYAAFFSNAEEAQDAFDRLAS